jgi:hypothetical protein
MSDPWNKQTEGITNNRITNIHPEKFGIDPDQTKNPDIRSSDHSCFGVWVV